MLNIDIDSTKIADIFNISKDVFSDLAPLVIILLGVFLGVFIIETIVGLVMSRNEKIKNENEN